MLRPIFIYVQKTVKFQKMYTFKIGLNLNKHFCKLQKLLHLGK